MRCPMIFAKGAALLLPVLAMAGPQARAQNQTPANVAPVAGVWTDPATGLTWTKQDNGSNVDWNHANTYCSNLRLGGYSDWRLPTIDELQAIYDANASVSGWHVEHVKGDLHLSAKFEWSSSSKKAKDAWAFAYTYGGKADLPIGIHMLRALCVRR